MVRVRNVLCCWVAVASWPGQMSLADGATAAAVARRAVPTADQLAYQDLELGAMFTFNIGEYGTKTDNYACAHGALPITAFAPNGTIDTDRWIEGVAALGGTYALLTAQAGCGFLLWPSRVVHKGGPLRGQLYNQTVRESGYAGRDLVGQFVVSCQKYRIKPAMYVSLLTQR